MRRLLYYAFLLALAVAIGAYIVLDSLSPDDASKSGLSPSADEAVRATAAASAPNGAEADSICQRDAERLEQLRSHPSRGELVRFADNLGCTKLLPQIVDLMEKVTLAPSAADVSAAGPAEAQTANDAAHPAAIQAGADVARRSAAQVTNEAAPPAPPLARPDVAAPSDAQAANEAAHSAPPSGSGADGAALTSDETCKRDAEHLEQLRSHPSRGELVRFADNLGCTKLLPQIVDLMESVALAPSAADVSAAGPAEAHAASDPAHPAAIPAGADVARPSDAQVTNEAAPPASPLARPDVATPSGAQAANEAAHSAPPSGAGADGAALTSDETCKRDAERLEQLRSRPSSGDLVHFANTLGCTKLLPQVVGLMETLAPPVAAEAPGPAPSDAQAANEATQPAPPHPGADVAALTSDETCKRDNDRLTRLLASPSGEEAERFASELGCEALRPQLQRLMESLGVLAPAAAAPANSSLPSNNLLPQACVSERAALDRLRKEPSTAAVGLFWRDLKCEGLRPQVRLLMESLNVAPEALGSDATRNEAATNAGGAPDAPIANGSDPAVCRKETAELNRIRATPDPVDAERFASAVTCDALKPQAARLLDSVRE
jgi:hypothetical protein